MAPLDSDNCSTPNSSVRGKDVVGCVRQPKRQNKHLFYTIVKKPSNTTKKPYKVVKIEIFDASKLESDSTCEPDLAAQYTACTIFDNVLEDSLKIIKDIQETFYP